MPTEFFEFLKGNESLFQVAAALSFFILVFLSGLLNKLISSPGVTPSVLSIVKLFLYTFLCIFLILLISVFAIKIFPFDKNHKESTEQTEVPKPPKNIDTSKTTKPPLISTISFSGKILDINNDNQGVPNVKIVFRGSLVGHSGSSGDFDIKIDRNLSLNEELFFESENCGATKFLLKKGRSNFNGIAIILTCKN